MAQPSPAGLQLRSLHILSDYHHGWRLRATAGAFVVTSNRPGWTGGATKAPGLNLRPASASTCCACPATTRAATAPWPRGQATAPRWTTQPGKMTFHFGIFNADIGLTATGERDARRAGIRPPTAWAATHLASAKLQWRPLHQGLGGLRLLSFRPSERG